MPRDPQPIKWLLSTGVAILLLLAGIFWFPATWIDFLFSPLVLSPSEQASAPQTWLTLLPPPEMEVVPAEQEDSDPTPKNKPRPEASDPRWWTAGWKIRLDSQRGGLVVPSRRDTVEVVLRALNRSPDLFTRVLPDSALRKRLLLLQITDGMAFDEIKPLLQAATKSRAVADKISRELDIFNEPIPSIPAPYQGNEK